MKGVPNNTKEDHQKSFWIPIARLAKTNLFNRNFKTIKILTQKNILVIKQKQRIKERHRIFKEEK